jgi:hypothetical protein
MAKPERSWQVTEHERIEKLDDNLWTVRGRIPGREVGDRRMAIVKRSDGRLLFYNAIPLEEGALAEVLAWGTPAFLVLPYNLHMMDGHAFQARLGLQVFGPAQDGKMAARVKVEGGFDAVPSDPAVRVEALDGMKSGEPVMIVESAGGERQSLVFADALMNIPGEGASLFARLAGLAGGPRVPRVIKWAFVRDKRALRAHLERLAALPRLARLIPSHGGIVVDDAAGVLRRIAATL